MFRLFVVLHQGKLLEDTAVTDYHVHVSQCVGSAKTAFHYYSCSRMTLPVVRNRPHSPMRDRRVFDAVPGAYQSNISRVRGTRPDS